MIDLLREQLLAPRYLGWLLDGWLTTMWSSLLVVAGATVLGVAVAAGRSSDRPALRRATAAYVSLFRSLLKCNGGAQRFAQNGWKSFAECKGRRELDCETDRSSRDESRA